MTQSRHYDAVVIGGGVNGLSAAAYLARAGKHTLLVDEFASPDGPSQVFDRQSDRLAPSVSDLVDALDPRVTTELELTSYGLKFAVRDAPLTLLREEGDHITLTRDVRMSARSIASHSRADADAWPRYRRDIFALGRSMRTLWWETDGEPDGNTTIERLARTGAGAWLDSWFESDALKSLLAFDASLLSPLDAGSALLLVWRAAQEMCGLQAACALPKGGQAAIAKALVNVCEAAGVEIRTGIAIAELVVDRDHVTGARLQSGEIILAPTVLSSLSRRTTLLELAGGAQVGFAGQLELAHSPPPVASAKIVLTLNGLPELAGMSGAPKSRFVVANGVESYVLTHAAASAGRIPEEPIMEVFFPSVADPTLAPAGQHLASVVVRPVPANIEGGWPAMKTTFAARVLAGLSKRIPGLLNSVIGIEVFTPDAQTDRYGDGFEHRAFSHLLANWQERVRTPIGGLYLCGADADVVPAPSGRAGRIAAALAIGSGGG
jgi:phytoene dehydrogenase-like protein